MLNLFSNAVKYNKTGGCVDTYAEEISDDGTTAMYEFKIVDTRIGMSPAFVKEELSSHLRRKISRCQNTVQRHRAWHVDRERAG